MSTPSVLKKICATKRDEVAARCAQRGEAELRARIAELPACRDFHGALAERVAREEPAIIAEFKRASPSAGWIHRDADAGDVARAYEQGGAACMSVLTDVEYFRGSDAVLLIVAALDDAQLTDFSALGFELGLSVLVEVHDAEEMDRALKVPGHLLGINNRDLHVFETRLETSEQLAPRIPADRIGVCESGLHTRADIERMQTAGLHAFLIGESLMRGGEPVASLEALRGR